MMAGAHRADKGTNHGSNIQNAAALVASSHFSRRDYIEGCKRREYFHLDDPGGSALLSRRQTVNWTPMAAIRLCTSQCPIRRRCYSLVADSADNPQISAA